MLMEKTETITIFDHYSETFQSTDNAYVNCEILDLGGDPKYDDLNRKYYKRADCCMLIYDITDNSSFQQCQKYYKQEIKKYCKKDIKVILVGNKTDKKDQRKIPTKEGEEFATENGYYFQETSCEKNLNVADAFETIIINTNNDMIKTGKENLGEKKNLDTFKKEEGADKMQYDFENNEGENLVKINVEKRTKKKIKFCCC